MTIEEAFALAVQYHQQGNYNQAAQLYSQVLQADPSHAAAACNFGIIFVQHGRFDEGIAHYQQALRLNPNYAEAYYNLGNAYTKQGRLADALGSYQAAVRLNPDHPEMRFSLAQTLGDLGRLDESIKAFEDLVEREPQWPKTYLNLGHFLQRRGRIDEAVAAFREYIALQPQDPRGRQNLGLAFAARDDLAAAETELRTALRIKPDYPEAHNGLGVVLERMGKPDEAIAAWRETLRLRPRQPEALNNLGNIYTQQGLLDEAIDSFRQCLADQPQLTFVHSSLLLTMHYHPGFSPGMLFSEHRGWAERHAAPLGAPRPPEIKNPNPERQLRLGYVSADFRGHTVAAFLEPLLAARDRERFHLSCYASIGRPDAVTERLRTHADEWRSIGSLSDVETDALIRKDNIDILVDFGGHTGGNRLLVFARKPAPIQVSLFGYPDTTGLIAIDYRITDPFADPPGTTEQFHTEQLYRLPEVAWCYQPSEDSPPVSALPAATNGYITFGCFNNLAKVTGQVVDVWASLLKKLPTARLQLLSDKGTLGNRRVLDAFQLTGINADRVELLARRPKSEYWHLYDGIDVALDPFPYNGGVTTCDAFWMGVPIIALAGRTYVSRQGVSLLNAVGLTEWVAASPDEYVIQALRRAEDVAGLRTLRAELRDRARQSTLLDAAKFTRQLEDAFRTMWRRKCAASS